MRAALTEQTKGGTHISFQHGVGGCLYIPALLGEERIKVKCIYSE